ncbi:hypothetical protein FOZ62_017450 [Perkinsus olseni]|nr:hypothetical protein FOZ62_017450 [Perkinsus olseni]
MPHKRSAPAVKARRVKQRRRQAATVGALLHVLSVVGGASSDALGASGGPEGEPLLSSSLPSASALRKNVDFLTEFGSSPAEGQQFTDGTGVFARFPDLAQGSCVPVRHHASAIMNILATSVRSFGLDEYFESIMKAGGSVENADELDSLLQKAATPCRQAMCAALHVSPSPATSGADFRAELFAALLRCSGDVDQTLPQCLLDPRGLPAGIENDIPPSGCYPVFKPNYTKIRREEPPSMAAAFESHYPSVDEAGLRLWEVVARDVDKGHMEWVSPSSPDAVFVKCAVICKGGTDARGESVRLSDPAVQIRVVEDYKENGVNRCAVDRSLLHETTLLPQLKDYRMVMEAVAGRMQELGEDWAVCQLDFAGAFRNLPVDRSESKYLSIQLLSPDDKLVAARHLRYPFGLRSSPLWWGRVSGALVRIFNWLTKAYRRVVILYVDDVSLICLRSSLAFLSAALCLFLTTLSFPLSFSKIFVGKDVNKIIGFLMQL